LSEPSIILSSQIKVKGKALERLERILGMFEKVYQKKAAADKKPDRWVWVPTDRELTLAEWSQQVEELNQCEAEKRRQRAEMNDSSSKTTEMRFRAN
jgi:hypothetical protein